MSRLPRFLLTPRWLGLFGVALVVAAACVRLGIWQLDRLEQRRALNDRILSSLTAPTASTLEELTAQDPGSFDYRRVRVTGTYDTEHEVLWYGRSLEGRPGHHVLTPLVYGEGRAVIVDRGWVPAELDVPPVAVAAPPSGVVTVTGFLVPAERTGDVVIDRDAAGRALTVRFPAPAGLEREMPFELFPAPLQLQRQSPEPGELPVVVAPPELSEGPHLSYAVQWFTFATITVLGTALLARRELRDRARSAAVSGGHPPAAPSPD